MGDVLARLDQLADRHGLEPDVTTRLDALLGVLEDPEAPTTVHARAEAIDVHLADSLVALEVEDVWRAARLADVGAGAGLPGLALAAALPRTNVVLVEAARRKVEFIAGAVAAMDLANTEVEWSRAEEWSAGIDTCDVVCARALASLPVLCEYASPLLLDGGVLICWKGAVPAEEAADGRAAAAMLGLSEPEVRPVSPFVGSERRTLWIFRKVAPTPPGFPRRPGMATKRPLSADTSPPN